LEQVTRLELANAPHKAELYEDPAPPDFKNRGNTAILGGGSEFIKIVWSR